MIRIHPHDPVPVTPAWRFATRLVLVLATALIVLAGTAAAQTATVKVTVVDAEGNPQPYIDVRIEPADGSPYSNADLTDETGTFRFVGVPAGKYKVSAVTDGMYSDSYEITLGPGGSADMRILLKRFEAESVVVEVNANLAELVDTKEVSTSTTFTGEFIDKIPMVNRRIEDVVAMMPGVIRVGGADSTDISIGGGTSAQIGYRINGISGNDVVDGGLAIALPTAAIASFKLISAGASAKYGEQSTGIAEIITKGGKNENDFTYEVQYRDTNYGAQSIPALDDANKVVDDLLRAAGSPLESEVRAGFRLLGVSPLSTTDDDNNPVPRSRIRQTVSAGGPIVKEKAFFHATLESLRDDYGSPFVQGRDQNDQLLYTSKVNWDLWKKDAASNRLEFTTNLDVRDNAGFAGLTAPRSVNTLQTSAAWTLGITDTHVFANLGVLESKLSLAHQYETSRPEDVRTGVGTNYQIPLPPGGPITYTVGAAGSSFDQTVDTIRGEVNYAKAVGKRDQHTIDVGFNGDTTSFRSFQAIGTQVADFRVVDDTRLFGNPDPVFGREVTFGPPVETNDDAWYAAIYASDNWQVTPNFNLQMGLRAEYQTFVGKIFLAPRIGFSLDPIGDGRTRFFGNWGLYHDRLFANFLQYTQQPDRFWTDLAFADNYPMQARDFSDISIVNLYKEAQSTAFDSQSPTAVAFMIPDLHDRFVAGDDLTAPTNQDWTLGISRQLPGRVRLEVTFRSNKRTHQITNDTIQRTVRQNRGERIIRDIVYGTSGEGRFRQWAVEVGRPFSKVWSMNLSYVQSRNYGPIAPPNNPVDPNDVLFVDGVLGNDRTHVVKLQSTTKIGKGKKAWDGSTDFTWQTGLPTTASIVRSTGTRVEPIGRNSLRLPSSRYLNFGVSKSWQLNTAEGGGFLPTVQFRAQVFNVLNELNVTGALGRFRVPPGTSNPQSFPPLRPDLIVTNVDLTRSLEVGFSVSF